MELNPVLCGEYSVTKTVYLIPIRQSIIIQEFLMIWSLCLSLRNCIDQIPSFETNSGSSGQQTHCFLWDLKFRYSSQKSSLSYDFILSQINAALYQILFLYYNYYFLS
jgi:hypothetical protein